MGNKTEKHIDLELGAKILSADILEAKKIIRAMLNCFYNDRQELNKLYQEEKWEGFTSLIHKIKGGIYYCGTPALNSIVNELHQSLKLKNFQLIHTHYQKFLSEIALVRKSIYLIK